MQVQRVSRASNRNVVSILLGCGVIVLACGFFGLLALLGGFFFYRDSIVGVGLQAAGLAPQGSIEQVVAQFEAPAEPPPQVIQPSVPQTYSFSLSGVGQGSVSNIPQAPLVVGQDTQGSPLATLSTTEADLLNICRQYSAICSPTGFSEQGYTVRGVSFDLKDGGAVVSGEVQLASLGGIWQRAGLVVSVSSAGNTLQVRGVEIGGMVYNAPPTAEIGVLMSRAESALNDAVRQLVVNTQGQQFSPQQIILQENQLTVVLR